MLFRKKKTKEIEEMLAQTSRPYWGEVWKHYRKNRLALWALRLLFVFLFIGLFADFIANDKPIYCKIEGQHYWPVFRQYAVDAGWAKWPLEFYAKPWSEREYEALWLPLIPYSATILDSRNALFKSPFGKQEVRSTRYWHWLGTDLIGRDVAAGMIRGTRIAMLVGVIAMSFATLIGILLGGLAGYFGDDRLRMTRTRLMLNLLGILSAVFYGFQVRSYVLTEGGALGWELSKSLLIVLAILAFVNLLASMLEKIRYLQKRIRIPIDIIVMRLIEVFNSIPGFLLLLAVLAVIDKPSIFNVMLIIGFLSWTGIARFVRAELLRVRQLSFIEAAQAMGFPEYRIIWRHALPNVLTPVLITIAFGIAAAILLESFLSFLGLGLAIEEVTWGKLLNAVRSHFSAWWLALFPGIAIFVTVTLFNLIGEGLTDALNPRLRQ